MFEVVLGCQMKIKKPSNASQMQQGDGEDGEEMENPPLSKVEDKKGTKLLSEAVDCGRHRVHLILRVIHFLLILYTR